MIKISDDNKHLVLAWAYVILASIIIFVIDESTKNPFLIFGTNFPIVFTTLWIFNIEMRKYAGVK